MASHLSTLITRVKRTVKVNRKLADEKLRLQASLSHAFNLAEYMSYADDFSPEEAKEAIRLLDLMGLPHRVDEEHGAGFYDVMQKLVGDGKIYTVPSRSCQRCGRDLSNNLSIQHGMGPVCYAKRAREIALTVSQIDKEQVIDGMDKIAKESDPELDAALGIEPENQPAGLKSNPWSFVIKDPRWDQELAAMKPLPAANPEPKPKKTHQANLFMYI